MRTFELAVAAGAFVAQANAFDAMSIPDFVAGFMYGMTGDNHLTEIEACYKGGQQTVIDAKAALKDFTAGNYFSGLKEAGVVWNEVGSSMTTCKGMDEDIAAIENWATIFTEPTVLSKTIAKNWLFHSKTIKADIAQEEADWSAGSYFNAGVDTAKALTEAVGPIQTTQAANMPLEAPVLFLAGFLEGMVGDNHLAEIQLCATDSEALVMNVEKVFGDLKAGALFKAAEDLKATVGAFPQTLSDCKSMGDDVAAIEAWAQIFTSPTNLVADVTKHLVLHRSKIMGELHEVEADWSAGQYMAAGKEAALLMTDAVGPIQTAKSTPENLDLLMVPEIAAGFVYGMVGDNHLAEMESCYQGVQPLWTHLEAALKDVESFHLLGAMKEFEAFVYHFQEDVAPCMAMSEDVAAIEAWAQIFKNPTSLVSTATKHYLLHKKAVTADITAVKADYANKSYFSVGKDAADLLTVLVGPIQ